MNIAEMFDTGNTNKIWADSDEGITLAAVTNINDPDNLGRIKCKPVSMDEDVAETDWCFCVSPWGGNEYGIFFFPNVDDLVLLAYISGDVHRPVVLGSVWKGKVAAPYKIESGKNEVCSIKSPKGVEIKLELTDAKEKVTITTPSGALIKIDDEEKSITVQDKGGDNSLKMDLDGGKIELKAKTELKLSAGDTTAKLTAQGDIEFKSSKALKAESAQVNLKAQSALNAEGATVEVKAQGQMTLQSSGLAALKGSMVKIN